jgi:hypothetical protein
MQRKLTLDVDTLQVASFDASPAIAETRGTVAAREGKVACAWSAVLNSCVFTQRTCASWEFSCRAADGAIL